jgi:hypothetical protein
MSTRRTILTGLAALPLAPVHALADTSDPIFAAIEAHRIAEAAEEVASEARAAVEEPLRARYEKGALTFTEWRRCLDENPGFQVLVDRSMAALDDEENAFRALLATVPTTEAGRLALMRYGCELDLEGNVPCTGAPRPFRVLAALAGIPEQNAPMPDEDDE